MEKKETIVKKEKRAIDKKHIWIEDVSVTGADYALMGDRVITALEQFCGIKDVEFLYIRKEGNHLEIGKAEVEYDLKDAPNVTAKTTCLM